MAELFVQMSVSLDGFVEDRNAAMDWFAGDDAFDEILTQTVRAIDAIIFGRKTFELGAAYWPHAHDVAETSVVAEQIDLMNSLPKYVLSRTPLNATWTNSHPVGIDAIANLKAEAKRPIGLFAGASAAQSVLNVNLVDELRLIRYPVLLGGGTPLFAVDGQRRTLRPIATQHFESGPTVTRYALDDTPRS